MVRDFLGLRECGEEKESGGAFDLFGALKAVMLFRGRLNESIFGIFFTKYLISTRPDPYFCLTLRCKRSIFGCGIQKVKQKIE